QIVDNGDGLAATSGFLDAQLRDNLRRNRLIADELAAAFTVTGRPPAFRTDASRSRRVDRTRVSITHLVQDIRISDLSPSTLVLGSPWLRSPRSKDEGPRTFLEAAMTRLQLGTIVAVFIVLACFGASGLRAQDKPLTTSQPKVEVLVTTQLSEVGL